MTYNKKILTLTTFTCLLFAAPSNAMQNNTGYWTKFAALFSFASHSTSAPTQEINPFATRTICYQGTTIAATAETSNQSFQHLTPDDICYDVSASPANPNNYAYTSFFNKPRIHLVHDQTRAYYDAGSALVFFPMLTTSGNGRYVANKAADNFRGVIGESVMMYDAVKNNAQKPLIAPGVVSTKFSPSSERSLLGTTQIQKSNDTHLLLSAYEVDEAGTKALFSTPIGLSIDIGQAFHWHPKNTPLLQITSDDGKNFVIVNVDTKKTVLTLKNENYTCCNAAFDESGEHFAAWTANNDKRGLCIYDVKQGALQQYIPVETDCGWLPGFAWSGDKLILALNNSLQQYKLGEKALTTIHTTKNPIKQAEMAHDGTIALRQEDTAAIELYNVAKAALIKTVNTNEYAVPFVYRVQWAADNTTLHLIGSGKEGIGLTQINTTQS